WFFDSSGELTSPLGATQLIPRFVLWTREDLLAAVLILQNNRKLRTGLCCFQNILIAVALRIQDKGFEFFIDLEDVGAMENQLMVSLAFIFVDDDFHFSSFTQPVTG